MVRVTAKPASTKKTEACGGASGHTLDSVSLAAAILDPAGHILDANRPFHEGWTVEENGISGSPFSGLLHADDTEALAKTLAGLKAKAAPPATIELRFKRADGAFRSGLCTLSTLPGKGSSKPSVLLQIMPLDAVKQRYETLAVDEERWRFALNASRLGVWDHNFRDKKFEFSPLWLNIRGFDKPDELLHNTPEWIHQVHPDDRDFVQTAVDRQNNNDPDYTVFRYRIRHRNGEWIWIECRGMGVQWDADGKLLRAIGTDADVTSRKDWEDQMTAMSRRVRLALDISSIGVFEANLTQGVTEWDDRMYDIYGLDKKQTVYVGDAWEKLLHPEDRDRVLEKMNFHLENLLPHSDEFRIVRPDGTVAYIRSRSQPFIESGTGDHKVIGADWDVSEDVEMQRQLRQARDLAEAHNRELEAARARIEHNALHDHLTGLPNRRYLDQILDGIANDVNVAILHIDLDRFKEINDTAGHAAGDAMLRYAADVLSGCVRKEDFIARIGGDEFVVLSRSRSPQGYLIPLAKRIIRELCKPVEIGGISYRIGASIGIASRQKQGQDARQLLQNSDIALYRAKNLGRNRHEIFSPDMQHEIIRLKKTADEILQALERREFVPHYQLQFDARTLNVCGVETLARWNHPDKGVLSPDKFLTVAENLDVMATIDAQILEQAVRDFAKWQSAGLSIPKISVNVSARRLSDPQLDLSLKGLPIQPGTVSFELLESVFLDDHDRVVEENLRTLQSRGIDIEIDDFGSGHASIVGLVRLGPKMLKIDRELVQPILNSPEQRRLVRSIIDIGQSLNIRVMAEGVETAAHISILRDLGCDALQGFALARPMTAKDLPTFLRDSKWRDILPLA